MADIGPPVKKSNTGKFVIIGFAIFLLVGGYYYQRFIPPAWLHDFGADIALRAAADPNAPVPEDSRQASPRGLADSPYICVSKIVQVPWDHMIVATSGDALRTNAVLAAAAWPDESVEAFAAKMAQDPRFQLIVLLKGNTVSAAEFFYTFWADLKEIARPEGFTRDEAVFTSASQNGVYVVAPAADAPANACK
ncbi:MAG: hypothetical protein ACKVP1_16210 [Burkholderiaceae bacterium]